MKKLEELFDLPESQPHPDVDPVQTDQPYPSDGIEGNLHVLPDTLASLDKIESALPAVKGLEASDQEMDELAAKASKEFDNLMDLGMNVDSRYASEIFAVASQMLGHAITAKTAKINKKLKMIQLQLAKAKMDQANPDIAVSHDSTGMVLDRNEMLQKLLQGRRSDSKDKD